MMKYHKYPSTTILKHVNVLSKLGKPPYIIWSKWHHTRYVQYYNPRMHNENIGHYLRTSQKSNEPCDVQTQIPKADYYQGSIIKF